jgi:hypothetical protein
MRTLEKHVAVIIAQYLHFEARIFHPTVLTLYLPIARTYRRRLVDPCASSTPSFVTPR